MKKDQLHILGKIEAVEPSPFLFTRIQAKVQEQLQNRFSTRKSIVYLTGIAVIIALNVIVLRTNSTPNEQADLVSEMNLTPSHQLYP